MPDPTVRPPAASRSRRLGAGKRLLAARHVVLVVLGLAFSAGWASSQGLSEAQVKASYLVNFVRYVEWPAAGTSYTLCLLGRENLVTHLAAYEGRTVGGRELRVRRINSVDAATDCHVVFAAESEEAKFPALMKAMDSLPILTVSDSESFIGEGGAIGLVRNDGRLQFDVNANALVKAGLKANSSMLRVARRIVGK